MEYFEGFEAERSRKIRRRRRRPTGLWITILIAVVAIILLIFGLLYVTHKLPDSFYGKPSPTEEESQTETQKPSESVTETPVETTEEPTTLVGMDIIEKAEFQAGMYDYDEAIKTLQSMPDYESYQAVTDKIAEYNDAKLRLVKWADNTQITHVFFHSLIYDTNLAFHSDMADEYNQVMTTIDEFNKILDAMHDKGYVLVNLHDMAELVQQEDGTYKMTTKPIYLPKGKIPFVMSQDDVCYYEYMDGDGFASRLVVKPDGHVTTEMDLADGSTVTGSYDLIPILEDYINEHPDFSYRGAKAVIAVTGYNGVFGYRTSEYTYGAASENPNPNIEADRQKVKEVAAALRATGFEIASHSWGHRDYGKIPYEHFTWDANLWEEEVESLVGETDILLYPFGADIDSWKDYPDSNERYQYLSNLGFHYYCNVDSNPIWVQIRRGYLRQGRRNLDGTRMYEAIVAKDRLSDLFDAKEVFDPARPTPVKGVTPTQPASEAAPTPTPAPPADANAPEAEGAVGQE